jgi:hypothetical protein
MHRTASVLRPAAAASASALALALLAPLAALVAPSNARPAAALAAQDANIYVAVSKVEQRMRDEPLVILSNADTRFLGDRTQRVTLNYADEDGGPMQVKWAQAPRNGSAFNNEPRYEIGAYELQKLFLDEPNYVVPPTVGRAVPLAWIRQYDPEAQPTFGGIESVILVVQYWLNRVSPDNYYDRARFDADSVYARHFADFNLLTDLIEHRDMNSGNYLISTDPVSLRVFSVDNGVAFRSEPSDRGEEFKNLRVDRLPHATVERLRRITEEELHQRLGVLLQYEVRDGQLVAVPPGANLSDGRGVRREGTVVQFGLTRAEIRDVWNRIRDVLGRVDSGRIKVF